MELLVSCMRYVQKVLSVCFNTALEDWSSVVRNPNGNFMLIKSQMPVVSLWVNQIIMTIFRLLKLLNCIYQIVGKKLWTSWCIGLSWCWITCEWCWIINESIPALILLCWKVLFKSLAFARVYGIIHRKNHLIVSW